MALTRRILGEYHWAGRTKNLEPGLFHRRDPEYPNRNWGTTQSRVKQAGLREAQAKTRIVVCAKEITRGNSIGSMRKRRPRATSWKGWRARRNWRGKPEARDTPLSKRGIDVLEVVDAQNTFALASGAYQDGAVRYRVALANLQTLTEY